LPIDDADIISHEPLTPQLDIWRRDETETDRHFD
jgi:hypothetical protein